MQNKPKLLLLDESAIYPPSQARRPRHARAGRPRHENDKTKPIYFVLRDAYCENEFVKTKPLGFEPGYCKSCY